MVTKKFSKEFLLNDLEILWSDDLVLDEVVDTSRWLTHHKIVFKHEDKYWLGYYSVGSTEQQDTGPWEYEDEVVFTQVQQKEVLVKQWVEVE